MKADYGRRLPRSASVIWLPAAAAVVAQRGVGRLWRFRQLLTDSRRICQRPPLPRTSSSVLRLVTSSESEL